MLSIFSCACWLSVESHVLFIAKLLSSFSSCENWYSREMMSVVQHCTYSVSCQVPWFLEVYPTGGGVTPQSEQIYLHQFHQQEVYTRMQIRGWLCHFLKTPLTLMAVSWLEGCPELNSHEPKFLYRTRGAPSKLQFHSFRHSVLSNLCPGCLALGKSVPW